MPSTTEQVHNYLESDPTLQDGLDRGVLSLRQTARWLLSETGWDATEEAVVSALRRHTIDPDAITVAMGRQLLSEAHVDVRSGLALVTLPRELESYEGLQELWGKLEIEDMVGALPGDTRVRFLLEEHCLDTAIRTLGPSWVQDSARPVSGIRLFFPEAEQATSPAMSIVLHALGQHGVDVLDVFSCDPECSMLVPGSQEVLAHEVVWALTRLGRET